MIIMKMRIDYKVDVGPDPSQLGQPRIDRLAEFEGMRGASRPLLRIFDAGVDEHPAPIAFNRGHPHRDVDDSRCCSLDRRALLRSYGTKPERVHGVCRNYG